MAKNGVSHEYVMGVMQAGENNINAASGRSPINHSGFIGPYSCPECDDQTDSENTSGKEWPSSKYYDLYDSGASQQEYQRGKLGDATKEMGPFYVVSYLKSNETYGPRRNVSSYNADLADFVAPMAPWFMRGGTYLNGTDAGMFTFSYYQGIAHSSIGFRIILTP